MPAIWNVNNGYGTANKKISSKLTFEVGEKFAGRISSNTDDGSVFVKMTDGWEFPAELQKNNTDLAQGLMQFQVVGYDGDKIKLAVLKNPEEKKENIDDNLKRFASTEGIDEDDISLLKSMLEHDIELTKDKISFVKSLVDFNKKIKDSPEEKEQFVLKYLQSKGIDENSEEGKQIKNTLNNFLEKYQGMSKEEIMLFLENNIEINEENIDSFNKLFKGDETIKEMLDKVNSSFKDIDTTSSSNNKLVNTSPILTSEEMEAEENKQNGIGKNVIPKIYESNTANKSNINVIGLLKSLSGNDSEILKMPLKDILNARNDLFTSTEFKSANSKLEKLTDNEVLQNIFKSQSAADINSLSKDSLQKVISNIVGKQINITDDEFSKIKEFINVKLANIDNGEAASDKVSNSFINNGQKIVIDFEKFKNNIEEIFDSRKNDFKGIMRENAQKNIDNFDNQKIKDTIKENLNKYNMVTKEKFNSILSDLFGKNVNLIKDEVDALKDSIVSMKNDSISQEKAQISSKSEYTKFSEALKNSNGIKQFLNDSLKDVSNKFSKNDLDSIAKNISKLSDNKLSNIIKEEMIKSNENLGERVFTRLLKESSMMSKENVRIRSNLKSSSELIQDDLKLKINNMKDTVKDIIQKTNQSMLSDKIMELINSNINDFKLFNSLSNEYYYLDVPVNANNKEYPCKLIIKDKRKDDKKIDKTSIKMVVAVKTVHIGNVDGYLYVRNNKIDVNLKCEKPYMKILSVAKNKLKEKLDEIGFSSDVTVSENKQKVNLATCREFFNNDNVKRIDTKV